MTPATPPICCVCPSNLPAAQIVRILPRRGLEHPPEAVRRALAWPGTAFPVDLPVCGKPACLKAARDLAICVLSVTALGDEVAVRTVME